MANKLDDMKVRLAELSIERAQLDTAIEEMIADLAELPPERRSANNWAPDGASTRKYLELTERQAAVETEIFDLNRAIVETDEPPSSLH
jgi:inhibitor of KinA sporulation pathway (predicted exonuclease)